MQPYLINQDVGVTGDDSSSGKVDPLPHQILAHTTSFAHDSLPKAFEWSVAALLRLLRGIIDLVVNHRAEVVL